MDIAAMSLSLSACSTNTNISMAMMSKILDTVEVTGEALTHTGSGGAYRCSRLKSGDLPFSADKKNRS